jgi:AhpD family alkylhydroperoxidase
MVAADWQLLLGDWFFERNQFQQFHRLVEHCPTDLPCNTATTCKYAASGPAPGGSCSAQLVKDGCVASAGQEACDSCAGKHQSNLQAAGSTPKLVDQLCAGGGPAPAPAANCSGAEKQYCPGLAGGGAGKGDPCFACVVKFEDPLIAAGCFAGAGSGKRHAFIEAFCK